MIRGDSPFNALLVRCARVARTLGAAVARPSGRRDTARGRRLLVRTFQLLLALLFFTALFCLFPRVAWAQRIKHLARVDGIRSVHLTGIGLVIGLSGTGDSQRNGVLKKYYVQVLANMGTGIAPDVTDVQTGNTAIVMVNATIPSSMKPATEFAVTVSSIGDAESLRGGYLLAVPLKLPYAYEPGEGTVYAEADGPIASEDSRMARLTRASAPAVLRAPLDERPFPTNLEEIVLLLDRPEFATASDIAAGINGCASFRGVEAGCESRPLAVPDGPGTVRVRIPTCYLREDRVVEFISKVLALEVADVEREPIVAIDRESGSVVVSGDVAVSSPAVIAFRGTTVRIPAPEGRENARGAGGNGPRRRRLLVDVLRALESPDLEFTGGDIVHVLEQLNEVGAVRGRFVEK